MRQSWWCERAHDRLEISESCLDLIDFGGNDWSKPMHVDLPPSSCMPANMSVVLNCRIIYIRFVSYDFSGLNNTLVAEII